jgi:hypothetical protein
VNVLDRRRPQQVSVGTGTTERKRRLKFPQADPAACRAVEHKVLRVGAVVPARGKERSQFSKEKGERKERKRTFLPHGCERRRDQEE